MPAALSYPGVYLEEISSGVRTDLSSNYAPVVSRLCPLLLPCWAGGAMAMGA